MKAIHPSIHPFKSSKSRFLFVFLLLWGKSFSQKTIALHPENPHYFQWRGKPTVLVTSGEHYGAVMNLDFDFVTYLNTLQRDRLNLTRLFSGPYLEPPGAFNITSNNMAPRAERYVCPWARSGEPGVATPGNAHGGNRFDLTRWDEAYFQRLKTFLTEAEKRGIVVELALFCPFYEDIQWNISPFKDGNNVNGLGKVKGHDVHTLDRHGGLLPIQEAYVRKIVTELNGFGNLLFEICNEPYFGGVTIPWQHHIADLIVATEQRLPNKHLITQNMANGYQKIENPHPAVSVFNFHYATPPRTVAMNYGLNRALGDNETGFRSTADSTYRKEGWEYLLAGGALYNNLDYSFTVQHPDGTAPLGPKEPGGGSPALRRQLRTLREFMERVDFVHARPDSMLLAGPLPPKARLHALHQPGREVAGYVYHAFHGPQPEPVQIPLNLPAGRYALTWTNPETGVQQRQTLRHPGGVATLTTLPMGVDVAFFLKKQ